jgi:hypothetical protein
MNGVVYIAFCGGRAFFVAVVLIQLAGVAVSQV